MLWGFPANEAHGQRSTRQDAGLALREPAYEAPVGHLPGQLRDALGFRRRAEGAWRRYKPVAA
jgi:hypothetical protein